MGMYFVRDKKAVPIGRLLAEGGATHKPTLNAMESFVLTLDGGTPVKFQEIGLGKPLTIEIREVYTGKYPSQGFFQPDRSMLITSAMKGLLTTGGQPRAVNYLTGKLKPKSRLKAVAATDPGTGLVCYSPAVTEGSYSLTIEVGFNTFNDTLLKQIGSIFKSAATFPLFVAAAPYLVGADMVFKIGADLGHLLLNAGTVLAHTQSLDIFHPGVPPLPAGYYWIVPDGPEGEALRASCTLTEDGTVVGSDKKPYSGDVPYVVISLDGREQEEKFKQFTPLQATADQLSSFFNLGDSGAAVAGSIVSALKLANDLEFRTRADRTAKLLAGETEGSDRYKELKAQYEALLKNIQSDEMKPPKA